MTLRAISPAKALYVFAIIAIAIVPIRARAFEVFYAGMYSDTPNFADYGIKTAKIFYPNEIWLYSDSRDDPPTQTEVDRVVERYQTKSANPGDLVVLDIEHWSLSNDTLRVNSRKLADTMSRFKAHFPSMAMGFYGLLPHRDYYKAIDNSPSWRQLNSKLNTLAADVDAVFPSLYTLSSDHQHWSLFAKNMLHEASQYGKPVYAFVWPQYHQSVNFKGGEFINAEDWRRQLSLIRQHADGVVIWGGWDVRKTSGNKRMAWDPEAKWWQVTLEFLEKQAD